MTIETPVRPRVASLSCASCGAAIESHAQGWAVTIVCASCGAVLDATDENLRVLQRQEAALRFSPRIPLGTRGTWKGAAWVVIGVQNVTISVEGVDYSWREYVLFNPYRGFLYLSEYQGHWNVIEKLRRRPEEGSAGGRPMAMLDGEQYKHFQTATARTTMALGEFPWELRVGDAVVSRDFVAPPYILSAEASDGEETWSRGTYTPPEVIAKAFNLAGDMMRPIGVFANQPNPHLGTASAVGKRMLLFLAVLAAMLVVNLSLASRAEVFNTRYTFASTEGGSAAADSAVFVTAPFALSGRPSSVDIDVETDLENNWMFFSFSLINATTGDSRDLTEQVSYYHGRDSDGSWSEGSRRGHVRVAAVPAGRYFLRVAPEGGEPNAPETHYTLRVTRDSPSVGFYVVALLALVLPALLALVPRASFEARRWQESDYAASTGSDDDGDDDE